MIKFNQEIVASYAEIAKLCDVRTVDLRNHAAPSRGFIPRRLRSEIGHKRRWRAGEIFTFLVGYKIRRIVRVSSAFDAAANVVTPGRFNSRTFKAKYLLFGMRRGRTWTVVRDSPAPVKGYPADYSIVSIAGLFDLFEQWAGERVRQ